MSVSVQRHVVSGRFTPRLRPVLLPILLALILASVWSWSGRFGISKVMLPMPKDVWQAFVGGHAILWEHFRQTAVEALLGLCLSASSGLFLALLIASNAMLRRALLPNLIALHMIPKVAMAPLFVIWIGVGGETRLAFSAFLAFFPVVVSASTGLTSTDPNLIRLCQAYAASPLRTLFAVRLPAALPHIFSGLKVGATMTMIGLIVGEFVTAQSGLGYLTMFAAENLETPFMIAVILSICTIGATLYVLMTLLQHVVMRRFES